jgi:glutamate dehydrogenase
MYQASSEQHRKIVSAVVRSAVRPPKSMRSLDWPRFLKAYYANVDAADLAAREPAELAGMALSHLMFARRRRRSALVRVFNPTLREHGYTSPHTVIEMVNDDMPFLVDSISVSLTQRALTLHFLTHPIFAVARDAAGTLLSLLERGEASKDKNQPAAGKLRLESFQHIEVDRIVDPAALHSLAAQIERSMRDVRVACADWGKMQKAAHQTAQDLSSLGARFDPNDLSEAVALLTWMENRHFTFLGYREYRLQGRKGRETLQRIASTGLGLLRPGHKQPQSTTRTLSSDIRRQSRSRDLILVTKANFESTVHRSGYLDYVGVKQFDAKGRLIGERRFLGLWTSAAYSSNPREIPVLRHKVAQVVGHFALAPDSHDGKALQHILEGFPRDELFQASVAELNRIVTGVFGLQERPRVRVLLRRDAFRRFYSCLVFVPREKYNTQVRQRIEKVIREALSATGMESQVQIAESNLARIHIVARTSPSEEARIDTDALERRVAAAVRSWSDGFKTALLSRLDEAHALHLFEKYAQAFPAAYTEDFQGDAAALDVSFLEAVEKEPARLHLDIYRPEPRRKDKFFLKIFRNQDAIPISDLLPMLENMGLKVIAERPYELEFPGGRRAWIQDLELVMQASTVTRFESLEREIKSTFTAVWTGRMDSDSFNQLTLTAGIPWRLVIVMRAYCRYLLQTGLPFSQGYIAQVLANNAPIARLLADLFVARFSPEIPAATRQIALARLDRRIRAALEDVTRSDEDRILRALWDALSATVRTNAYQSGPEGQLKEYLSFKIESQRLRAAAEAVVRDFRVFAPHGRCASAHGIRRARRHSLVGSARGFPHGSARSDEGTEREEHGDRSRRSQGRLRRQAHAGRARGATGRSDRVLSNAHQRPSGYYRQYRRRQDRRAAAGGPPRQGRRLSGGGRGQGHRDLFRHRQRHFRGVRLLARRCIRVRRFGRLRPQEDGDHGARRVGVREAALPRNWRRHSEPEFLGRGNRRHGGRRIRQRDAAIAPHPAGRGLQSPAHLHRSATGSRALVRRAGTAVQNAPLQLGGLFTRGDFQGGRRVFKGGEEPGPVARSASAARASRASHPQRGGQGHSEDARRSVLERRNRHLRQGHFRKSQRRRRPQQ